MPTLSLDAFGGWQGVIAFYFIGLAFPICYGLRVRYSHDQTHIHRQGHELVASGFIVCFGGILCLLYPSQVFLYPHVIQANRTYASWFDIAIASTVTATTGSLAGFARLRRTVKADQHALSIGIPAPEPNWWHPEGLELVHTIQAERFTDSTWLTLFTLWIMNIAAGFLTVCIGKMAVENIPWWLVPVYNIGGHAALFHGVCGALEASFHPSRVEIMHEAQRCESREERDLYWCWVFEKGISVKCLRRHNWFGRQGQLAEEHDSGV